uniref:Uncharacterized protein n=1 Tax=Anguilla anguilla TaxID=7936 RepID=A0A0E9T9I1_ANGAN
MCPSLYPKELRAVAIDSDLDLGFLYIIFIQSINMLLNPIHLNVSSRYNQSAVSNAFSASRLRSIDGSFLDPATDCRFKVLLMLFVPWRPGINPVRSG